MTNTFGENLRKYRKDKQMGINELGRLVGVSGAYISALETGKKLNPSLDIIDKLSNALDVSTSLLTSKNSKFNSILPIDMAEIRQSTDRINTYIKFISLLGYNVEIETIDNEGYQAFFIDDVQYSFEQFDTLLEIIKTCIQNSNSLLKSK